MANLSINHYMKTVAALVLKLSLLLTISTAQATTEFPDYKQTIEKIVQNCQSIQTSAVKSTSSLEIETSSEYVSCFTQEMVNEMRKRPQYRELILESALRANSKYIPELIEAAIEAGMAPLVTLMRAIDIYPKYGEEIRRGAMSAGVDPFVVTEATSGLEN